ncbi:hypothetical protein IWQ61_007038 [Dispira simplex]|nr:hypothetical protein IWQ61_007038 [Dispira simplex]
MQLSTRLIRTYLNRLLLRCHPDFFQCYPIAKQTNQESLQTLNTLLEPLLASNAPWIEPSQQLSQYTSSQSDHQGSNRNRSDFSKDNVALLLKHWEEWQNKPQGAKIVFYHRPELARGLTNDSQGKPSNQISHRFVFDNLPNYTDLVSHRTAPALAAYHWYSVAEQFLTLLGTLGDVPVTELVSMAHTQRQKWKARMGSAAPNGNTPSGHYRRFRSTLRPPSDRNDLREQFRRGLYQTFSTAESSALHDLSHQTHPSSPCNLNPRHIFLAIPGLSQSQRMDILQFLNTVIQCHGRVLQFYRWHHLPIMVAQHFSRDPPGFIVMPPRFQISGK